MNHYSKTKIAILISGRGSNMMSIIKACGDPEFPAEVALVVSNRNDAPGIEFSRSKGIKTLIIDHKEFLKYPNAREAFDREVDGQLEKYEIELVCLAGFMRLLSPWFVNKWSRKLINIHPSLLPNFKGANAVEDAFNSKALYSGCTVHYVTEEMDEGPIILQKKVPILESDNLESLKEKILKQEHIVYPKAIRDILSS